jgi:hypothetical protein
MFVGNHSVLLGNVKNLNGVTTKVFHRGRIKRKVQDRGATRSAVLSSTGRVAGLPISSYIFQRSNTGSRVCQHGPCCSHGLVPIHFPGRQHGRPCGPARAVLQCETLKFF